MIVIGYGGRFNWYKDTWIYLREALRSTVTFCSNAPAGPDTVKIAVGTVKNHVHQILRKLNAKNRKEAAALARAVQQQNEASPPSDSRTVPGCAGGVAKEQEERQLSQVDRIAYY